jgi:hypothetical protein
MDLYPIDPETGLEMTIEQQRNHQDLFPPGPARDILHKALQKRMRKYSDQLIHDSLLTQEQLFTEHRCQEIRRATLLAEHTAIEKKVMLELHADPTANVHGYSQERVVELAAMASGISRFVQPGDAGEFIQAVTAIDNYDAMKRQIVRRAERQEAREKATCDHCGTAGALQKCSGCNSTTAARYCNAACQRLAWKENHKNSCPRITKKPNRKKV